MEVRIAQTLIDAIDKSLNSTLSTGTSNLMMGAGAIFGICWLLYLNIKSIHWHFQGLDVAVEELIVTLIKSSIIIYFAFNVSWYISTIVPVVNELPTWAGKVLSSSGGGQTNLIDTLISQYISTLAATIEAMKFSPVSDFGGTVLGILGLLFLLIGGIPFLLVCVGTLITLKAATTAILVLGPVFIAFSLFPVTRQYFYGWVSVIGGFILTQILFSIILTLEMNFINSNVVNNGEIQSDLLTCFSILLYFGAFTVLATEIPMYAASIMGGTPMGAVGGVGGLIGRGTGIKSSMRMAKGVGRGIGWMRGKFGNNIS